MSVELAGFELTEATYEGAPRPMYRGGTGPGVIVIHEIPGITPPVADFARRLVGAGFTVFMPSLFGTPGKRKTMGYTLSTIARACVSKEFHCLALDKPSPSPDGYELWPGTSTTNSVVPASGWSACA